MEIELDDDEPDKELADEDYGDEEFTVALVAATTKEIAWKYLDACPVDVIKKFINRTWCFMDTYHKGLTGKALLWAIWKFRQHWCISEDALKAFEEDSQHRAGQ